MKKHINWTEDKWRNVIWSDEPRFCVQNSKRDKRILRKEGKRYDERNVVSKVKWSDGGGGSGGSGAMARGCFLGGCFGLLEIIDTNFVD